MREILRARGIIDPNEEMKRKGKEPADSHRKPDADGQRNW